MLTNHLYSVHAPKVQCTICCRYIKKRSLGRHLKTHNYDVGRMLHCNGCSSSFSRKDNLKKHQKKYHGTGKVEISDGNDTDTSTNGLLKQNLEKKETFPCMMCDKFFMSKRMLTHHLRIHINIEETKKMCDMCNEGFKDDQQLFEHKLR